MSETDLALAYVIKERCQPHMALAGVLVAGLAAGLAANGHPGVQIAVDWPVFLGCTEDGIVDTLTGYYRREAERLEREARACPGRASQDIADAVRQFLAIPDGQVTLRELAAARWARIKAA